FAAGAAWLTGFPFDRNARSRSKSVAVITPAFAAPLRSPSEYCIVAMLHFHAAPIMGGARSLVCTALNNVQFYFEHCSYGRVKRLWGDGRRNGGTPAGAPLPPEGKWEGPWKLVKSAEAAPPVSFLRANARRISPTSPLQGEV